MKKILIIEDDPILLSTISAILNVRGYETTLAKNGKEGMEMISKNKYDLVLTDLMLPHSNGLEIISLLNQEKEKTPVIIISSTHTEDAIMDGFSIGADDYIRKPFTPSELILRISRLI
ncbi:response regulator transcription factor [Chryseobacterium sp. A321]